MKIQAFKRIVIKRGIKGGMWFQFEEMWLEKGAVEQSPLNTFVKEINDNTVSDKSKAKR